MKDYEKHIRSTYNNPYPMSLCGNPLYGEFYFENVDHAFWTRKEKGRLIICPDCLKEVLKVLKEENGIQEIIDCCHKIQTQKSNVSTQEIVNYCIEACPLLAEHYKETFEMVEDIKDFFDEAKEIK